MAPVAPIHRPAPLLPLYFTFTALQVMDYTSTTRALASGVGQEGNPVMSAVVANRGAFMAVKAATAAGVIFAGEKMWKKNRVGAVIFMASLNAAMGTIVAHNYAVGRR